MKQLSNMAIQNYLISAFLIFHGVQGGWIDPDTPQDKRTTTSLIDGTEYKLVSAKSQQIPRWMYWLLTTTDIFLFH